MSIVVKELSYPHIGSDPGIARGVPIIQGTRITIRCLAGYYQMGMDVDEIIQTLPHLTAAQVHAGLAFYFDHQAEIDQSLAESSDVDYWKTQIIPHPKAKQAP